MIFYYYADFHPKTISLQNEDNNQYFNLRQNNTKSCLLFNLISNGNITGYNVRYSISLTHGYSFVEYEVQTAEINFIEGNCK